MLSDAIWVADGGECRRGLPLLAHRGGTALAEKLVIVPPVGVSWVRAVSTPGQYTSSVTMGSLIAARPRISARSCWTLSYFGIWVLRL